MRKFFSGLLVFIGIACSILFFNPRYSSANVKYLGSSRGTHTISIFDEVIEGDFVEFYNVINSHKYVKKWVLLLDTPGGSAVTTVGIINYMMFLEAKGFVFHGIVFGQACSAGSYIFLACNKRTIHEGAFLLWHTARAQLSDLEYSVLPKETKEYLNTVDNFIRKFFKARTGKSDKVVWYWLDSSRGQLMTAKQARDMGIATEYIPNNFNLVPNTNKR